MASERLEMTHAQWSAEGARRFGPDVLTWRFVCPSCGHVASVDDWVKAGAKNQVAFSCIGRSVGGREAFGEGKGPCNYAGGGLFRLNPVTVAFDDGHTQEYFAFAAPEPHHGTAGRGADRA